MCKHSMNKYVPFLSFTAIFVTEKVKQKCSGSYTDVTQSMQFHSFWKKIHEVYRKVKPQNVCSMQIKEELPNKQAQFSLQAHSDFQPNYTCSTIWTHCLYWFCTRGIQIVTSDCFMECLRNFWLLWLNALLEYFSTQLFLIHGFAQQILICWNITMTSWMSS